MAHLRYYSPRLDRDLISWLYHEARTEHVPKTALASRLIREGQDQKNRTSGSVVAEEPPT